jgi:hypothetical protein
MHVQLTQGILGKVRSESEMNNAGQQSNPL